MRNLRNLMWFLVGVGIVGALMLPSAYAQTASVDPAFHRIMNDVIRNTPGVVTNNVSNGVTTVGTGTAKVTTAAGLNIPVPQTATATVPKSAIAKAAGRVLRAGSIAGWAFTAWEVYDAYEESGLHTCPPPDFFCKEVSPGDSSQLTVLHYRGAWNGNVTAWTIDRAKACNDFATVRAPTLSLYGVASGTTTCTLYYTANNAQFTSGALQSMQRCSDGSTANTSLPVGQQCPVIPPVVGPYANDSELEQAINDKLTQDPARAKALYDAVRADNVRYGVLDETYVLPKDTPLNFPPDTSIVLPPDTPLSIWSPNVYTPEKVVKTETKPMSDGSTVLEITKSTTTVGTEITGTTVGDTKITHPITTTETKTSTNTTTGQVTTSTTVINESPQVKEQAEPVEPVDPCKANPNRAGCALLGEPPAAEEIPSQDIPITVTPVPFASVAGCPSSLAFEAYGAKSISYQPMCDTMTTVRPLFLALASLTAAIVFMGALKL